MEITELLGKTLSNVVINDAKDEIKFYTEGKCYRMYHIQDCCESVTIEDVCGDLDDLLGSPIVLAEKVTNREDPTTVTMGYVPDMLPAPVAHLAGAAADHPAAVHDVHDLKSYESSYLWTFYKLGTQKGSVTIRWFGASNGYYGEEVDFAQEEAT